MPYSKTEAAKIEAEMGCNPLKAIDVARQRWALRARMREGDRLGKPIRGAY